eukprot:m.24392 g.24392  ORF g.24392 m.24392 type:complete len:442 (+) comp11504_c0_seq1:158-1483(+)
MLSWFSRFFQPATGPGVNAEEVAQATITAFAPYFAILILCLLVLSVVVLWAFKDQLLYSIRKLWPAAPTAATMEHDLVLNMAIKQRASLAAQFPDENQGSTWVLQARPEAAPALRHFTGVVVSVIGTFNAGKSLLLRMLADLPSLGSVGETVHTKGLAFKHIFNPGRNQEILVCDTEGLYSPCEFGVPLRDLQQDVNIDWLMKRPDGVNAFEHSLQLQETQDAVHVHAAMQMSNICILVINELTQQSFRLANNTATEIQRNVQNGQGAIEFWLVHNVRAVVNAQELQQIFRERQEVFQFYMPPAMEEERYDIAGTRGDIVPYTINRIATPDLPAMRHFFLVDARTHWGALYNKATIDQMRQTLFVAAPVYGAYDGPDWNNFQPLHSAVERVVGQALRDGAEKASVNFVNDPANDMTTRVQIQNQETVRLARSFTVTDFWDP